MAEEIEGEGLSYFIVNVPFAALSRRRFVLRCGVIVNVLAVFYRNDCNNAFNRRLFNGVFVRAYTLQYLVGAADLGNSYCPNNSFFLSCAEALRKD